jgi:hypothetical protein
VGKKAAHRILSKDLAMKLVLPLGLLISLTSAIVLRAEDSTKKALPATSTAKTRSFDGVEIAKTEEEIKESLLFAEQWKSFDWEGNRLLVGLTSHGDGESYIDVHGYLYNQYFKEWRRFCLVRTRSLYQGEIGLDKTEKELYLLGKANTPMQGKRVFRYDLRLLSDDRAYIRDKQDTDAKQPNAKGQTLGMRDEPLANRLTALGQEERIRALVEMLASKNTAPTGGGGRLDYPKDYDKSNQAVVYLAMQQLLAEGSAAFETLLAHCDDKRFSYTNHDGSGDYRHSVGDACYQVMWRNVLCYDLEIHLLTMDQCRIDPWLGKDFAVWLKDNKDRPLWELQTEAIDRAVRFFENVDREKATATHPDAQKLPAEVFEQKRKANIEILRSMRASIHANKQPYRPRTIDNYWNNMRDLPWRTRIIGK